MGWGLIGVYYLIAYVLTPSQRGRLVISFFTVVILIGIAGMAYEFITTGTIVPVALPD